MPSFIFLVSQSRSEGGANVGVSDFIVMRITFGDGFTGYIGEIDLSTNLGS